MDIGLRIKKINELLTKEANHSMQALDITFTQHHVLVALARRENHTAALKELEHQFGVAQATMAGICVRLEEKGLIRSFKDPQDKRIKKVVLTEDGNSLCRRSYEHMIQEEEKMKSFYSEEELQQLFELLDRLYDHLKKRTDENPEGGEKEC